MDSLQRFPDWLPLQRALNAELGADARAATCVFHFVNFVQGPADVGELRVYQHARTRVHLTLDMDGRAYRYFAEMDGYGRTEMEHALMAALTGVA